jgi:hypothetical protein
VVHASASSQGAALGTHVHWPKVPQTSSVQGFWSSKHGAPGAGVPKQAPNWHVSFVVHGFRSVHCVPLTGVPMQKPAVHVSPVVQSLPSSH